LFTAAYRSKNVPAGMQYQLPGDPGKLTGKKGRFTSGGEQLFFSEK
jgi:hypothetical protein